MKKTTTIDPLVILWVLCLIIICFNPTSPFWYYLSFVGFAMSLLGIMFDMPRFYLHLTREYEDPIDE